MTFKAKGKARRVARIKQQSRGIACDELGTSYSRGGEPGSVAPSGGDVVENRAERRARERQEGRQ